MKKDIILSGVGGQGILSIATVIGEAATIAGLHLKQAEVHGMSQRGGDVESDLRLSTEEIASDLIPRGKADIIISMEPMESLRYVTFLHKDSVVITNNKSFINIPNYPDQEALAKELKSLPHLVEADIEKIATDLHAPKSANMVLLGMAAKVIGILTKEQLEQAIRNIFSRKGEAIVESNLAAFRAGIEIK